MTNLDKLTAERECALALINQANNILDSLKDLPGTEDAQRVVNSYLVSALNTFDTINKAFLEALEQN